MHQDEKRKGLWTCQIVRVVAMQDYAVDMPRKVGA